MEKNKIVLNYKTICSHCKNKQQHCNFCSNTGAIYVEATDVTVGQWLLQQDEKTRKYFLDMLNNV